MIFYNVNFFGNDNFSLFGKRMSGGPLPKEVEAHLQIFEKDSKINIIDQQIQQLRINFSVTQFHIILNDLEEIKAHLNYLFPNEDAMDKQQYGDCIYNCECRILYSLIHSFAEVYHLHWAELHNDKSLINRLIKLGILA